MRRSQFKLYSEVKKLKPVIMKYIVDYNNKIRPIDLAKNMGLLKEETGKPDHAMNVALRELSEDGYLRPGKYYTLLKSYDSIDDEIIDRDDPKELNQSEIDNEQDLSDKCDDTVVLHSMPIFATSSSGELENTIIDSGISLKELYDFVMRDHQMTLQYFQHLNKSLYEIQLELSKNNSRKDFPKYVQDIWLKVDLDKFEGRCPCCMVTIIADERGWIPDMSQSAHFNDSDMNRLIDGARICVPCHSEHREKGKNRPHSILTFWEFCRWEEEKRNKSYPLKFKPGGLQQDSESIDLRSIT